jgi:LacI family transcriptional regulator
MYEMTTHVIDVHHYDDVCFIAGPEGSHDSLSRFAGFRAACLERGRRAPDRPEYRGDFTTAGGAAMVARLLAEGRMPRALLCANDQTAIGAMSALRQARRRVPADVAVTGFDGVHVGRHLHPGLTTVVQPMRELGETAVRILQRRITDAAVDGQDIQLPVRVELRGSCGCRNPERDRQ